MFSSAQCGKRWRRYLKASLGVLVATLLLAGGRSARPQSPDEGTVKEFTREEAVDFALKNYPAVRASIEQANAARAGVGLARTDYLPRADVLWQGNRAPRNNVFGLLLPQAVIPAVSGPVLSTTSTQGVWGSAAGRPRFLGIARPWAPPRR